MKKIILVLGMLFLNFSPALGEKEIVYLQNGVQKSFTLLQQINASQTQRSVFKGWSSQEIQNFFQVANVLSYDNNATKALINKWGAFPDIESKAPEQLIVLGKDEKYTYVMSFYEENGFIRQFQRNRIPVDLFFAGNIYLFYFIENKISQKSLFSLIIYLFHTDALRGHNKSGTAPYDNTGSVIPFTYTIKF